MARALSFGCILCAALSTQSGSAATGETEELRSLLAVLRHNANVVETWSCRYRVTFEPTREEMAALIRKHKGSDAASYIYSGTARAERSYVATWKADGVRERFDIEHGQQRRLEVKAFDGQILRTLNPGQREGHIFTSDTSHWNTTNRLTPRSLLFEFQGELYADLIARSRTAQLVVVDGDTWRVFFRHPEFERRSFVLNYDKQRLLRQRDVLATLPPEAERIWERHYFDNYRTFSDEDGNAVEFPMRAVYRYYCGTGPDGTLMEYKAEHIDIEELSINVDIDPAIFKIQFPNDYGVWDGVRGRGMIAASTAELVGVPSGSHVVRRVILTAIAALFVTALGAFLYLRQRRR